MHTDKHCHNVYVGGQKHSKFRNNCYTN